jgi:uncharacterized protein (TIGR03067 family)
MSRKVLVLTVFALTVATFAWGARADRDELQGDWKETSVGAGKVIATPMFFQNAHFIFAGDKVTITNRDKRQEGTYKADPTRKPKTIDLTLKRTDKKDPVTLSGIYELSGDTLKIGFTEDSSKGVRPESLSGLKVLVFTLKREKR